MRIAGFVKLMVIVTAMAVLYTHLQIKIYAFAYDGKMKQKVIEQLDENNDIVKTDILRLRSSDNMGRQLLDQGDTYRFASQHNVVALQEVNQGGERILARQSSSDLLGRVMTLAFTER